MSIPRLSAADLALLGRYDTPTICNVIELFEVRPRQAGYMDGRIRACFPEMAPMVGYASTATMRCAAPRAEGAVYN
ncbi:MAG: RraA family protein, partial [Bryobacteraceae bacterium]